jgi:hypothetical protein
MCRKTVQFSESKLARRMIGNLPATCPNSCEDKFSRESLKQHLLKCPNRKYVCRICKTECPRDSFMEHLFRNHSDTLVEQYEEATYNHLNKPVIQQIIQPVVNVVPIMPSLPVKGSVKLNESIVNAKPLFFPQGNQVRFIAFKQSSNYVAKGQVIGTNRLEDLSDSSLTRGICCNKPGEIIIEFDKIYKFNMIHVGGYNGDKYNWHYATGNGAQIFTSPDNVKWIFVGNLNLQGSLNAEVKTNILTTTEAKFIKFSIDKFLGLGYLSIPYI